MLPLSLRNADETELCQSSTSLSNISHVFLREKLVWRNEVMDKGSIRISYQMVYASKKKNIELLLWLVGCVGFEIQAINSFFVFVSFFQVMPWNATSVSLLRAGMTAKIVHYR